MEYPILIYLTLVFVSSIFLGGASFVIYQYKLYKLTKFSSKWKPWRSSLIGLSLLEVGIVCATLSLFAGVFITYPDLFMVKEEFIPMFILIYGVLIVSSIGIWWATIGLRSYWKEVHELAVKSAS